jgi:hypothetical protein
MIVVLIVPTKGLKEIPNPLLQVEIIATWPKLLLYGDLPTILLTWVCYPFHVKQEACCLCGYVQLDNLLMMRSSFGGVFEYSTYCFSLSRITHLLQLFKFNVTFENVWMCGHEVPNCWLLTTRPYLFPITFVNWDVHLTKMITKGFKGF